MRALTVALFFLSFSAFSQADLYLTIESAPSVFVPGNTVYRFYVNMTDATDHLSAVFGTDQAPLELNTPDGAFNSAYNASWSASGINPAFLGFFPDMADDTYATIGLDGPASSSGIVGADDPSIVEDSGQAISPYFTTDGATSLLANTLTGASYYALNGAANGLPDANMRVLILQVTTTGPISGILNYQVFPQGVGVDQVQVTMPFDGAGTFIEDVFDQTCGCTDATACNYDDIAIYDDGSCLVNDECGVCGGNDLCLACGDGTYWDPELGQCLVTYPSDSNFDGCVDLNDLMDLLSIYGTCPGCIDPVACNYNNEAIHDDGSCLYNDDCVVCEGNDICQVCGDGTYWDPELSQCLVTYPSDSNFDGCTDINDLMDLLSTYGICL
jgi:hypothetical protein